MPPLPKLPLPNAPDTLSVEERMRWALGLTGDRAGRGSPSQAERPQAGPQGRPAGRSSAGKPRHRFVQDGAVPVTVVNRHHSDDEDGPPTSHAAMEAALRDERLARGRAQREQQDALASVQNMQTMLGHAELARREASGIAERARAAVDALRAEHRERELRWQEDLGAERAARLLAEAALAEATRAREPAPDQQGASPTPMAKVPAKPAVKRTRKAAAEPRQRESQPVKWWLKSARKRWP